VVEETDSERKLQGGLTSRASEEMERETMGPDKEVSERISLLSEKILRVPSPPPVINPSL
jgi:hypothetical protein